MDNRSGRVKLSIVVPVYFNAGNLPVTVERLLLLQEQLKDADLELVFVDDGSLDNSWEVINKLHGLHSGMIKAVKLTRNFGSMAAHNDGFRVATGNCIGMISADLQDPPELFTEMLLHWRNGSECVFAVRAERDGSFTEKLFSGLFYKLMRAFAVKDFPDGGFDFFLVDRKVVAAVKDSCEKNTHLMTLIFWFGFPYVTIPYRRRIRIAGKSRWTLSKKLKLLADAFAGFSYAPIRAASLTGILFAIAAFFYGGLIIIRRFIYGVEVPGWAALVLCIVFTSGLQLTMLGIIGEYVWRSLDAARRRPNYVIEKTCL